MAPNANRSESGNKSMETLRENNLGSGGRKNQPSSPDRVESNERRSGTGKSKIKNRTGSVSNQSGKKENTSSNKRKKSQPGAPQGNNKRSGNNNKAAELPKKARML
ncbi:MAG: hypothetical protein C4308_02720 [Chitinophagaceae bacterium]